MDQLTKWQQIAEELNEATLKRTNSQLLTHYRSALTSIKRQAKVYIEEYETLSFSQRLEAQRLLGVGEQIKSILDEANAQATGTIAKSTGTMAKNGYYSTFYGLEAEIGLNVPMSLLGEDFIEQLVNEPVAGKVFSRRLYENTDQLARATTQSLLQGAIDGKGYSYVAKRIEDLTEADYKKAIRIARTEGGRASSLSQQRAYDDAKDMGVNFKKRWVATFDEYTRNSHQEMDGQTVGVDEDFISPVTGARGQGPRLMGHPAEDINCRCTTIAIVDGYEPELRRDDQTLQEIKNMTYMEWLNYKGVPKTPPQITIPPIKPTVPMGPTYEKVTPDFLQANADYLASSISPDEEYAIKRYTGAAYDKMNRALYLNDPQLMRDYGDYIRNVDAALTKHPLGKNLEIYRGMKTFPDELIAQSGITKSQMVFIDELLDSYKYSTSSLSPGDLTIVETIAKKLEGTSYVHKSFMSTSHDRNKANNFGPIRFVLNADANVPGLAVESISEFAFEKEIIIGKGMKIEIDKVELEDVRTTNGLQAYLKIIARLVKP